MIFKTTIKKICSIMAATMIGFTLVFSSTTSSIVEAAKAKSQAEQEVEKYSLKELNTTKEGQRALYNYYCEAMGVNSDPNKNARLNSIMSTLSNAVSSIDPTIKKLPYVYFVNNNTSLNAFCSLGHVMSVNSGTFDSIINDDELAVVIGHEMGHGQKDHPYKGTKATQQKVLLANIGANIAGAVVGSAGSILTDLTAGILLNQSIAHGTKSQEKEADSLAFDYILNTNYNPGACAAIWQRFIDISGTAIQTKTEMFFSPSDHPNNVARRDRYVQKLYEYSGKKVTVKETSRSTVNKKIITKTKLIVNGKDFMETVATNGMSAAERSYFILGNLAVAYHRGYNKSNARVEGGTVYLGAQPIIAPVEGEGTAQDIADRLNQIK
ncbi:MAG: M48 family metallopeptidase [Selenomonadaceae bacterium]|nr:M48 family metallopeptidase [Selenomonadaceae bacterium]